jgi:hypothetical protein
MVWGDALINANLSDRLEVDPAGLILNDNFRVADKPSATISSSALKVGVWRAGRKFHRASEPLNERFPPPVASEVYKNGIVLRAIE